MATLNYLLIDARQAAEALGVTSKRVRVLCLQGRIPGARTLGRTWLIPARVRPGGVLDVKVTPGTSGPEMRFVAKAKKREAKS